MAKTAAERQSDRRKRLRYESEEGKAKYQLSALITRESFRRLGNLSRYAGTTKAELIDNLIRAEYERVTADMTSDEFRNFNL